MFWFTTTICEQIWKKKKKGANYAAKFAICHDKILQIFYEFFDLPFFQNHTTDKLKLLETVGQRPEKLFQYGMLVHCSLICSIQFWTWKRLTRVRNDPIELENAETSKPPLSFS